MNKKRIKKIDPIQAGKVLGVMYFFLMLIFIVPIFFIFSVAGVSNNSNMGVFQGLGIGFVFILPFIYALIAFILGIVTAYLYNFTYRFHGGHVIEFENDGEIVDEIGK